MDTPDELKIAARQASLPISERGPSYQEAFEYERGNVLRSMDLDDVLNELSEDEFLALVKAGDPNAVGRYVLSMMSAWADRLAAWAVDA